MFDLLSEVASVASTSASGFDSLSFAVSSLLTAEFESTEFVDLDVVSASFCKSVTSPSKEKIKLSSSFPIYSNFK